MLAELERTATGGDTAARGRRRRACSLIPTSATRHARRHARLRGRVPRVHGGAAPARAPAAALPRNPARSPCSSISWSTTPSAPGSRSRRRATIIGFALATGAATAGSCRSCSSSTRQAGRRRGTGLLARALPPRSVRSAPGAVRGGESKPVSTALYAQATAWCPGARLPAGRKVAAGRPSRAMPDARRDGPSRPGRCAASAERRRTAWRPRSWTGWRRWIGELAA